MCRGPATEFAPRLQLVFFKHGDTQMQRQQLGLVWGAFVTAAGAININSLLGFLIFLLGLAVSYRSAVAMGMPGAVEQVSKWRTDLRSVLPKKAPRADKHAREEQPT